MSTERCYLDHNATAPLLDGAREAMLAALDLVGNPSSVHRDGRAARAVVEEARRRVAALVRCASGQVVFTSGASEAASHVLTPSFRLGRAPLAIGALYVAATEHPCVLAGGRFPADRVHRLPVLASGILDLDHLKSRLAAHDMGLGAPMVAVMLANNETGVIQPIETIAPIVKAVGGILVVDAVQAAGRIAIDMAALGADYLILSSHKMGGPKGAGALVAAGEIMMPEPLVTGGGQEKGHRSGTENLSAIAGFGAAAHIGLVERSERAARLLDLRQKLEEGIMRHACDAVIAGRDAERLPNTTCVVVPGLKAETAQIAFDLDGISVSSGSACSSGKVGESHVLAAMGLTGADGGIRISTGPQTVAGDIDRFLAAFERLAACRSGLGSRSAA